MWREREKKIIWRERNESKEKILSGKKMWTEWKEDKMEILKEKMWREWTGTEIMNGQKKSQHQTLQNKKGKKKRCGNDGGNKPVDIKRT